MPQRRAAQYVRVSTNEQERGLAQQVDEISRYAAAHDVAIVRSYVDEGRSGLTLRRRPALQALLSDVLCPEPEFDAILVYDVSRWGRFQDIDEAAHYETLCRQAGVQVVYVAEPFEAELSEYGALVKNVKRAMAALFSEQLGDRVIERIRRQVAAGHHPSGPAPYGYQRWLMGPDGKPIVRLEHGQAKARSEQYVSLWPGPRAAVFVVREIFKRVSKPGETLREIADSLNARGTPAPGGGAWHPHSIYRLVSNPAYAGHTVCGRETGRLGGKRRRAPPGAWPMKRATHPAIVSQALFDAAQRLRRRLWTDDELLEGLRRLLDDHGRVCSSLISSDPGLPNPRTYAKHFGSMDRAYEQVGYDLGPVKKGRDESRRPRPQPDSVPSVQVPER